MKKRGKPLVVFATILIVVSLIFSVGFIFTFAFVRSRIDFIEDERLFEAAKSSTVTRFYATRPNGVSEYVEIEIDAITMGKELKNYYKIDDISEYLKDGFIAVEDKDFYSHSGVNFKRTLLAFVNRVFKKGRTFGASTITQQVVKNISGDNEVTIKRKLAEIFRAMHIESNHSKEEILELYLNIVPLGENIVGVGMGAEHYFNKSPADLLPEEAAVLIGLTNAPSVYNPYKNPEACVQKRNIVLSAMKKDGVISEEQYSKAVNSDLILAPGSKASEHRYSWFLETVIEDISNDYASKHGISTKSARLLLLSSGYEVYTTQNVDVQNILDAYFCDSENFAKSNAPDYSMVITDPASGDLLGIVGSHGEKEGNLLLNHALVPHTPASTLKPIALYAPLIESGKINWATVFDDVPVEFLDRNRPYPANSPNVYSGLITVKDAIKSSKNTVAVRLYDMLGADKIYTSLKNDFKFNTLLRSGYDYSGNKVTDLAVAPLALGQLSRGVSLRSLTEAYTVFASYGVLNKGRSYTKVLDSSGELILENKPEQKRIFSNETAKIMNQLLMNVTDSGTAKSISLKNTVDTAGKTGTSGGNLEKLFIGYTPYLAAGIRSSYNDGKTPIGDSSHLEIWDEVMTKIHDHYFDRYGENTKAFSTEGLLYLPYCKDSGELFAENCILDPRGNRMEYGYFTADNKPTAICKTHVIVDYDAETEAVAHPGCPRENIIKISLLDIPYRSFPCDVVILDAEYVYRKIDMDVVRGDRFDVPYFQNALQPDGYVGRGEKKRQFNHSCYLHD